MAAFDGLIALDMIEVTRNGFLDRENGNGGITKYKAKDRLLELLEGVEGNPFTDIKPDLDAESIILRDHIDGVRTLMVSALLSIMRMTLPPMTCASSTHASQNIGLISGSRMRTVLRFKKGSRWMMRSSQSISLSAF